MTRTFIICTEPAIERQSILFAESLRTFGGSFANDRIMSFAPRPGISISAATDRALKRWSVEHVDRSDNVEWAKHPTINKVFACALAEEAADTDVLIFADSDIIVLNPPSLLGLENADVAVRPVGARRIGVTSLEDNEGAEVEYWRRLYALAGVKKRETVHTTVTDEEILAYWNTGVVAVRRSLGLFQRWRDLLEQSTRAGIYPRSGQRFVDQTTFAATLLAAEGLCRLDLPPSYNYPGHRHNSLPSRLRKRSLSNIAMLHYHKVFQTLPPTIWARGFASDDRRDWVVAKIREHGLAAPLRRVLFNQARAVLRNTKATISSLR